jgi:hypothetical protein
LAKYEQKTKITEVSPNDFINSIENEKQKADAKVIMAIMKKVTGKSPKMWGPTMIGFDKYHYKYASGHEGDAFMAGFSPRKGKFSVYVACDISKYEDILKDLGKYKTGRSCLYINKLDDVNIKVLEKLITTAYKSSKAEYK